MGEFGVQARSEHDGGAAQDLAQRKVVAPGCAADLSAIAEAIIAEPPRERRE